LVVGTTSVKYGLQLPAAGAHRWWVGDNDGKLDEPTIASGVRDAEGAGVVVELCMETGWDGTGQQHWIRVRYGLPDSLCRLIHGKCLGGLHFQRQWRSGDPGNYPRCRRRR